MKVEYDRIIGDNIIVGDMMTQTRVLSFIPEENELKINIFDEGDLSKIPLIKSSFEGGADQIRCVINFTINRNLNSISINSLSFGVDEYGENPIFSIQSKNLSKLFFMKKIGFKKNEVDHEKLSKDYIKNALVDEIKVYLYNKAR